MDGMDIGLSVHMYMLYARNNDITIMHNAHCEIFPSFLLSPFSASCTKYKIKLDFKEIYSVYFS